MSDTNVDESKLPLEQSGGTVSANTTSEPTLIVPPPGSTTNSEPPITQPDEPAPDPIVSVQQQPEGNVNQGQLQLPTVEIESKTIPNREVSENYKAPKPQVDESEPNSNAPNGHRRFSGAGVMVILIILLIALPVAVYYISQRQSLNDIRNRAAGQYPTPMTIGPGCPSVSTCGCGGKTYTVCNTLLRDNFGSSCSSWCANPYATPAPVGNVTLGSPPAYNPVNGVRCSGFDAAQQANIDKIKAQNPNANNAIIGCIGNNCTWRDACAPIIQIPAGATGGGSCSDLTQISTGESYNGAFVGCSSTGLNCFCSGGGHVGDSNLTGVVRCYADYAGDSCGNQNGPHSPNTPGTTRPPGGTDTPNPTNPPGATNTPTKTPTKTPTVSPTSTVTNTPTHTPTATLSLTPTGTVTVTITTTGTPTNTPINTNTPTHTATPTPTSTTGCNYTCTINTDCPAGLVCADGACRNPQCTEQSSCQCASNTPTNTPISTATPTPTQIAYVGCNSACSVNTDCSAGLVCIDSACRNPSCTEKTNCQCDEIAIAPTPQTPVAGTGPSVMGAMVIAGGFFLLLFGLAL